MHGRSEALGRRIVATGNALDKVDSLDSGYRGNSPLGCVVSVFPLRGGQAPTIAIRDAGCAGRGSQGPTC